MCAAPDGGGFACRGCAGVRPGRVAGRDAGRGGAVCRGWRAHRPQAPRRAAGSRLALRGRCVGRDSVGRGRRGLPAATAGVTGGAAVRAGLGVWHVKTRVSVRVPACEPGHAKPPSVARVVTVTVGCAAVPGALWRPAAWPPGRRRWFAIGAAVPSECRAPSRPWRRGDRLSGLRFANLSLSSRRTIHGPDGVASSYSAALGAGGPCFKLESLSILLSRSDLVRVHPGRPAAFRQLRELRARTVTAGVRLPRPGHSESSFRMDPSVCPIMLRHRYR